jgi:hypothetical protein
MGGTVVRFRVFRREGKDSVKNLRLATWLCLLALASPAGADAPAAQDSALDRGIERGDLPEPSSRPGPLAVFAAFEEAWADGDPEALVEILDPEEKVRLSFTEGGPRGGYFNRDQAYYLLKDMLEFTRTDRFEFQKYWNLESDGRSPYAVALREFRMNDEDTHTDQVYVSLRKRGSDWYVGEICSLDR